jgi:phosphoribosylamine--glycine ligase
MLTADGPQVLEFNCRFGDPETQVILPLLDSDLLEIALGCTEGRLADVPVHWKAGAAACVVLASAGYPGKVRDGFPVSGLADVAGDAVCFQAGTVRSGGQIVSAGGRVLGVTAWAKTLSQAVERAYAGVARVGFEGRHFRTDIAWQAVGGQG